MAEIDKGLDLNKKDDLSLYILSIVNKLFKDKGLNLKINTIDSFSKENNHFFDYFAKSIIEPDELPELDLKQKTFSPRNSERNKYNMYLMEKIPSFQHYINSSNIYDFKNVIIEMLVRLYFKIDPEQIILKSNFIFQSIKKNKITNLYQIMNGYYLLSLLHFLTDGDTEKPTYYQSDEILQRSLQRNFEIAMVPYIFNERTFQSRHRDSFLLQIHAIFDTYSEKILLINVNRLVLKFINVIGKSIEFPIKFYSFSDILQENYLIDYVKKYLSSINSEDSFKKKLDKLNSIESVIDFLKEKETKLEVFVFDFETPRFREHSLVVFFRALFNIFFLKKSRKEIYKRCAIILGKNCGLKDYENFSDLGNVQYFIDLVKYVNKNEKGKNETNVSDLLTVFKNANIPLIINQEVLKRYQTLDIVDDLVFYQLKLILNKLPEYFRIKEMFINMFISIKSIKIPNTEILAESIKARQLFLNSQKQKENLLTEIKKISYSVDFNEDITRPQVQNLLSSEKFDPKEKPLKKSKYNVPEVFWNREVKDIFLDNGILYTKKEKPLNDIKNPVSDENINNKILYKLYKIFFYNESDNQWKFNSESFDELVADNYGSIEEKVPIVLYMNSNEKDLISINYHFIKGEYPILDQDEIFVYALCGDLFNRCLTFCPIEEDTSIKPLFLLLHVPQQKQNIKNICTIIYQAYTFLSLACHVNIVLLNHEKYSSDQVLFINNLNKIKYSDESNNKLMSLHNLVIGITGSNEFIKEEAPGENLLQDRCLKFIVLNNKFFNREEPSIAKILAKEKNRYTECFIDSNNFETYYEFNQKLNEVFFTNSFSSLSNTRDILSKLKFKSLSGLYLNLKFFSSKESKLYNNIKKRLRMIESKDKGKLKWFELINKLIQEIFEFTPEFDIDFRNQCNMNIYALIKSNLQDVIKEKIENKLNEISKNHLEGIKSQLESEKILYLEQHQIESLFNFHNAFLDEEFFKIIKHISSKFNQNSKSSLLIEFLFENNIELLESQKNQDREEFDKLFEKIYEINKIKNTVKEMDPSSASHQKTNYVFKEREVDQQIKIEIEVENFESEIEQDF